MKRINFLKLSITLPTIGFLPIFGNIFKKDEKQIMIDKMKSLIKEHFDIISDMEKKERYSNFEPYDIAKMDKIYDRLDDIQNEDHQLEQEFIKKFGKKSYAKYLPSIYEYMDKQIDASEYYGGWGMWDDDYNKMTKHYMKHEYNYDVL